MFKKLFRLGLGLALALGIFTVPASALPTGQMVFLYNNYTNITTATTTVIKSTSGLVSTFCVNTVGTTSTLVIWDNSSATGNKLGTWTTTAVGCYVLNTATLNGITVVTTGSPAADITVFWR